ncbi:MAG: sigma-70 family RNA polymerase sigma factor [Pirellulales bacterium]
MARTPPESDRDTLELRLEAARGGDAEAKERLFASCRSYLAVVARGELESWLQAKADSSDLVQLTLLEAHRDFDRFDGRSEGEWFAWLRRILAHNAADVARRFGKAAKRDVRREVRIADRADSRFDSRRGVPEPAAADATPSQQLIRADDQLRLAEAICQLPEDYREVVLLRNIQRLPFAEVAERMGRSRPATQMLWTRAIKKLQATMDTDPDA